MPRSPTKDALLGSRLGNITLLEKIGQGGMGVVYRGRHEGLSRDVAVKILPHTMSSEGSQLERFLREGRAASLIQHPNVVRVMDAGNQGGTSYLVMELVDGSSLGDILDAKGRLEPAMVERLAKGIADGLVAIHEQGIIHRDIKPDNILLGRDGIIKITDLGLARQMDDPDLNRLTATGMVVGTPLYVAPEAIRDNKTAGQASDIYSLGATLYHMVAGRPPFTGKTPYDVMRGHLDLRLQPLRESCKDVPDHLADLIERCLHKDPARRPDAATVSAVLAREHHFERPPTGRSGALVIAVVILVVVGALVAWQRLGSQLVGPGDPAVMASLHIESDRALEWREGDGSWQAVDGLLHLPAGAHALELRSSGLGPQALGALSVDLAPGAETSLRPDMRTAEVPAKVVQAPPESTGIWFVNGAGAGVGDNDLSLDRPGRYAVARWDAPGRAWWSCEVELGRDGRLSHGPWNRAEQPSGAAWTGPAIEGLPPYHVCTWLEVDWARRAHPALPGGHLWERGAARPSAPALGLDQGLVLAVEKGLGDRHRLPTLEEAHAISRHLGSPVWSRDAEGLRHEGDPSGAGSLLVLLEP